MGANLRRKWRDPGIGVSARKEGANLKKRFGTSNKEGA